MSEYVLLHVADVPLSPRAVSLVEAGAAMAKQVNWFDFVASDYGVVYTVLSALQRGRFCEWGSGLGVVTGMAEMLGYSAMGIEMHEPLVQRSRQLLQQFDLRSTIEVGDYFEREDRADLYFTYCWPNRVVKTEERFLEIAPAGARLLIYYGRNDIRWMQK